VITRFASGKFFFYEWLLVQRSSLRELLFHEAHGGGLMGHFGFQKSWMYCMSILLAKDEKGCAMNL
jgi:hypothetical protein